MLKWIALAAVGLWWARTRHPRYATGSKLQGCQGLGAARCAGARRALDLTYEGRYGTGRQTGVDGLFSGLEGIQAVRASR